MLRAFEYDGEVLRLSELSRRTSLHKATAHRILKTLEAEGLVERIGADRYRSRVKAQTSAGHRIGFATRGVDTPFSRAVADSVQRAAREARMEIVMVVSHRSPRTALRNVEALIREGVDLVIEFQSHERLAPAIASRFLEAKIPVIAIEIPHPGAVFFGANNYQAGLIGGRATAKWLREHWQGKVDCVLMVEEDIAGPLPKLRVTGMLAGMRELLPEIEQVRMIEIDGRGSLERTMEAVRRHVHHTPAQRTVVLAGNDPMALGALRAFEEAGRGQLCAVMGQNGTPEAREELRRANSPLVGSIAYFPERYGDEVIRLASAILAKRAVPPAVFTKHELLTRENVDIVYPLDGAVPPSLVSPMVS